MSNITVTDRMSVAEFKEKNNNCKIDFFPCTKKENLGKYFFVANGVSGYAHSDLIPYIEKKDFSEVIDRLQYCKILKEGQTEPVPCLFLGAKVAFSL